MKIEYQLTEADILQHQLYILSQSKSFQKRRSKGRMFLLLIYLITGIFVWQRNGPLFALVFYIVCLPLYFLYRKMEAKQYYRHIANYVHEQYKDSLKHDFAIEWDEDHITSSGGEHHQVLPWLELESITELDSLFILNFRNASAFVLPKKNLLGAEDIKKQLQAKAETLGVPFDVQTGWKWK